VQPLTSASGGWLAAPPPAYGGESFLRPRGALTIARAGGEAALDAFAASFGGAIGFESVDAAGVAARVPGICAGWIAGVAEPSCCDIDVAALHAACLAAARRAGVMLMTDSAVIALDRDAAGCTIATRAGAVRAAIVVNAAGAWASKVAALAGAAPIAITAYRRTMLQLAIDPPVPATLPLVLDIDGAFYFKPEAGGRLWLSPHDETAMPPGDVAPDEIDIARAIDRLEQVVDWRVLRRERAWAGLRSFAPDRAPVYGFDPHRPGFFWFAGQGGFGIQTAPAAAAIGAALLLDRTPDAMVRGIDVARYAPARFMW
jgi:D-arginine dehydrogenase